MDRNIGHPHVLSYGNIVGGFKVIKVFMVPDFTDIPLKTSLRFVTVIFVMGPKTDVMGPKTDLLSHTTTRNIYIQETLLE